MMKQLHISMFDYGVKNFAQLPLCLPEGTETVGYDAFLVQKSGHLQRIAHSPFQVTDADASVCEVPIIADGTLSVLVIENHNENGVTWYCADAYTRSLT